MRGVPYWRLEMFVAGTITQCPFMKSASCWEFSVWTVSKLLYDWDHDTVSHWRLQMWCGEVILARDNAYMGYNKYLAWDRNRGASRWIAHWRASLSTTAWIRSNFSNSCLCTTVNSTLPRRGWARSPSGPTGVLKKIKNVSKLTGFSFW